jgi:hypothetical protein
VSLDSDPHDPDLVLADDTATGGLEELLRGALAAAARAFSDALAA